MRKTYAEFCSRHTKALKLYKEIYARDKRFQQFIRVSKPLRTQTQPPPFPHSWVQVDIRCSPVLWASLRWRHGRSFPLLGLIVLTVNLIFQMRSPKPA